MSDVFFWCFICNLPVFRAFLLVQLDGLRLVRGFVVWVSLSVAAILFCLTPVAVAFLFHCVADRVWLRFVTGGARWIFFPCDGFGLVLEAVVVLWRLESVACCFCVASRWVIGLFRVVALFGFGGVYVALLVFVVVGSCPSLGVWLILVDLLVVGLSGAVGVFSVVRVNGSLWVGHFLALCDRFVCVMASLGRPLWRLRRPCVLRRVFFLIFGGHFE
ncbi:hypothetical protein [Paraburkholderia phenazinium]|uniref:hypothetical protein n=1 Tax=Paraburkholderia phenazinium TaxID=60549 RepID=UPI00115FAB0B|nr:hypothetical protein [Paraburkholderia phenazinium]